jgi:autophagy-related protein 5
MFFLQIINAMQKKEHKQLFQSLVNDKFDAFWAINRKLMEHVSGEAGFRNIPFRIHRQDQPFLQLPFQPFLASNGQALTLGELIQHVLPDIDPTAKHWRFIIHGIEVPIESPVQYLSEHLSYADNFLHICLVSGS